MRKIKITNTCQDIYIYIYICLTGRRANTNGTVLQPQGASVGQQGYPQTAYPQANYNPPPK